MLTVNDVKNNINNYKIENGVVINKINNQPIQDEEKILEIKSSILFYMEAKEKYDRLLKQSHSGKLKYNLEHYIQEQMKDFSVNNEVQEQGAISPYNKLVTEILNSNGHIQENWMGNNLKEGKYSILLEPKKDYFLSYLKLKFREKSLDIDDITINMDSSEFAKTGNSKITIDYKLKKYEKLHNNIENKNQQHIPAQTVFQHPKAKELNELENQKRIAKQNNDEVAYNYAQSNIEKIVKENLVSVTPEQWSSMNIDEQISFIQLKINESRTLHDKTSFDYWNANLVNLQKEKSNSNIIETELPSYNSQPINNTANISKSEIQQKEKDYKYYYEELMKAVRKRQTMKNVSDEEKKQITGEIFYNEGYLIKNLKTEEEFREIMTYVINDLSSNEFDNKLQNVILSDMQDKLNKNNKASETNNTYSEFDKYINNLKQNVNKVSKEFRKMYEDKYIDDNELEVLIKRMKELDENAMSLISVASNSKEREIINEIIEIINEERNKMKTVQNGIQDSVRRF